MKPEFPTQAHKEQARAIPVEVLRSEETVRVSSLSKRYGEVVAVDDVSFTLHAGTVTGFIGPNGSGKTTTLRILLGLAEPTGGEALVFGHRYRELDQPMSLVGAVLEFGDFDRGRSGRDHLRVLALAADLPLSRVDEVLELVGLSAAARRPVGAYSLGMRQRLGLGAALLGDPQLLVLDEPANGLDPAGVHWLRGFLRAFAERGATVLITSHILAEITQTVDRALIISRGRIVAHAPLEQLIDERRTLEEVYLELTSEEIS